MAQTVQNPLSGRVAAMEVVLRKLLERLGLDGDENRLDSTFAATSHAMVAAPGIYTKTSVEAPKSEPHNIGTTGTTGPIVTTPKKNKRTEKWQDLQIQYTVEMEEPPEKSNLHDLQNGVIARKFEKQHKIGEAGKKRNDEEMHGTESSLSKIRARHHSPSPLFVGLEPMGTMITCVSRVIDYRKYRMRYCRRVYPARNRWKFTISSNKATAYTQRSKYWMVPRP